MNITLLKPKLFDGGKIPTEEAKWLAFDADKE